MTAPHATTSTINTRRPSPTRVEKRKLNTLAAQRYRQKRVEQANNLETALKET
jgi:Basic region leucine zipper